MQPVLRCRLCNKPFDKDATLRRHGYYCRSRRVGITPRARSCTSCAKSKARCDNTWPECVRCQRKNIPCQYPVIRNGDAVAATLSSGDESTSPRQELPHYATKIRNGETDVDRDAVLEGTLATSAPELFGPGETYHGWHEVDLDFLNFLDEQGIESTSSPPRATSTALQSKPSTRQIASIPPMITLNVRSLIQRPNTKSGTERIAKLLFHNLESYPLMMLRQNALPPYIHPSLISFAAMNDDMEFLNNCINLMHMISKGIAGSRKLFWRNVRHECERMCEDYMKLNKWELLAAMQALSIYLLVRLHEGETEYNNFEALLLTAVTLISKQTNYNDANNRMKRDPYSQNSETYWREWIYEESKRRLCVVYQVVNMLVYFEPAMLCDLQTDLVLAPLPSKRRLWEATDAITWEAEKAKDRGTQDVFGLAANGQLVSLAQGMITCSEALQAYNAWDGKVPTKGEDWGEWCSEMDGLGGLVLLAATLYE